MIFFCFSSSSHLGNSLKVRNVPKTWTIVRRSGQRKQRQLSDVERWLELGLLYPPKTVHSTYPCVSCQWKERLRLPDLSSRLVLTATNRPITNCLAPPFFSWNKLRRENHYDQTVGPLTGALSST